MELSWQAQLTATQEEFQRASADLRSMFWITMAMLFLPRVGGQLNSYLDHRQMKSRGGYLRFTLSLCLEVLVATAIAPVLMLYQCRFVCATLLGRSVAWSGQARDGHVVSLREATAAHGILTCSARHPYSTWDWRRNSCPRLPSAVFLVDESGSVRLDDFDRDFQCDQQ